MRAASDVLIPAAGGFSSDVDSNPRAVPLFVREVWSCLGGVKETNF